MTKKHNEKQLRIRLTATCAFGIGCLVIGIAVGHFLIPPTKPALADAAEDRNSSIEESIATEQEEIGPLFDFPITRELGIDFHAEPPAFDRDEYLMIARS